MYHGSVFRKWDLHVHTPESFENLYSIKTGEKSQYGDNIWDKYIDALESLDDIQAVGITDYFCIDGYRKALEYRAKGRLQNIELILPNIEFRLDKFVKESRSINYHVIFSNDLSADDIQHDFLDQLKFEAAGGSKQWLTRHNIEEFGKSIKESQSRSKSDLDWVVGCKHIVVNLDDIIDVLKVKDIFKGKYILVLAEPEWAFLDWEGRDYPTRKNLLI